MDFDPVTSDSDNFDALLAASSLGAPQVRGVRAHTPSDIRDLFDARLDLMPQVPDEPYPVTANATPDRQVAEPVTADAADAGVRIGLVGAVTRGKSTLVNRLLSPGHLPDDRARELFGFLVPALGRTFFMPSAYLGPATAGLEAASALPGLLLSRERRRPRTGAGGGTLVYRWPTAFPNGTRRRPPILAPRVALWDMPGLGEGWGGRDVDPRTSLTLDVFAGSRCDERPTPAPLEHATGQVLVHWCSANLHDLGGPLTLWPVHPNPCRQWCSWCAYRRVPLLMLDGLRPAMGRWNELVQPYPLLGLAHVLAVLPGWAASETVWLRKLCDELADIAHPDRIPPPPAASMASLSPPRGLLSQNTMHTSGGLLTFGLPRRRLLVVRRGTHALWHLLPRHDLGRLRLYPTPAMRNPWLELTSMQLGPRRGSAPPRKLEGQRDSLACTVESDQGATTVRARTHLQLLTVGRPRPQPIPAVFLYRSDDPYAVRIAFGKRVGTQVEWVFARELLIEGLRCTAGAGDVRVYRQPAPPGGEEADRVHISLSSPEGRAVLSMPAGDLETFLAATRSAVVYGSEHQHMRVPWETLTEELWWHPNPHR
ncbi:SsgA family sporulation/cell division regulator [Streptomyces sp. NPDC008141]|uniref:SsgA family sporulation/cell division regulator n=1 Tax=Streptomyces sp. NPDC008141 TaxID=3364815 RepID=UPI0036E8AE0A